MSYSQISSRSESKYVVDIPTSPQVEKVEILERVIQENESQKVSYVINCSSPYLSIDCEKEQLGQILEIISYIINNPVKV